MENDNEQIRAQEALDAITDTRAGLADRLVTPWYYHPALGLLMAGLALVYGLDALRPSSLRFLFAFVVIVGCLGLAATYERMTGVSVGKPVGARSTWMLALFAVGLVGPIVWVIVAEPAQGVVVGVAVFLFVFTVVCGRAYDASLRADLRAGSE